MPTGLPRVWRSMPISKPLIAQHISAGQLNGPKSKTVSNENIMALNVLRNKNAQYARNQNPKRIKAFSGVDNGYLLLKVKIERGFTLTTANLTR